jgi:hypothetical protein
MYILIYSMEVREHEHSRLVTFYPLGLSHRNEVLESGKGWNMKTMATIIMGLGDGDVSNLFSEEYYFITSYLWYVTPWSFTLRIKS